MSVSHLQECPNCHRVDEWATKPMELGQMEKRSRRDAGYLTVFGDCLSAAREWQPGPLTYAREYEAAFRR